MNASSGSLQLLSSPIASVALWVVTSGMLDTGVWVVVTGTGVWEETGAVDWEDTSGVLDTEIWEVTGTGIDEVVGTVDWETPVTGVVTWAGTGVVDSMVRGVVESSVVQGTSVVTVVVGSSWPQVVWVTVTVTGIELVLGPKKGGWIEKSPCRGWDGAWTYSVRKREQHDQTRREAKYWLWRLISNGRFQGRPKQWDWLTLTKLVLLPSVGVLKKDRLDVMAFCSMTRSVSDQDVASYGPWDIPAEAATMATRVVTIARSNLKRVQAAILAKTKVNKRMWSDDLME